MSVTENITNKTMRIKKGKPFTNARFLKLGSRAAVDQALSRLVKKGILERVAQGVFVRPKENRFIGKVMPDVSQVIEAIAKDQGEVIQVHGAEAARRFKLSTQMPTMPVYYTNGSTREIKVGNLRAKLLHTSSPRKLQHAGKKPGLALSALWYLGKENINSEAIEQIQENLNQEEFEILRNSNMPAWMSNAIENFSMNNTYA